MKVLVTGYGGQLGYDVVKRLEFLDIECTGVDIDDFDITQEKEVREYILNYKPTVVVHCAAYTAVDRAEENRELCYNINVTGTENIANVCKELNIKMVYISSDYVFNGKGEKAFVVNDIKEPSNYYGETKSQGEDIVMNLLEKYYIIRTSWVFGKNGKNFVDTVLNVAREKGKMNVVYDQVGSPTYTFDLAKLLIDIIQTDNYGIYHASNEGYCSWYEFAKKIIKYSGLKCEINPIKTSEYESRAKRPCNSRLDKSKLEKEGFTRLRNWESALKDYLAECDIINMQKEKVTI